MSSAVGRLHPQTAMGPAMVVGQAVVENARGMLLILDDDVVEAVPAQGTHCPLAEHMAVGAPGGVARSRVPSPRMRRWKSVPSIEPRSWTGSIAAVNPNCDRQVSANPCDSTGCAGWPRRVHMTRANPCSVGKCQELSVCNGFPCASEASMSYLYGDSTPSTLEVNFIDFLRDVVECCVQILLADQSIVNGLARTRSLDHVAAAEVERLHKVGEVVSKAFEGVPLGEEDSAAARCAAAIVRSASDLVRAETAEILSALDGEINKREAQAAREREGCVKALETMLVKNDLPDMTLDVHLAITGGARYGCRARMTTRFGLDAVLDLEIPVNHLFERVVRVDRLTERLDVKVPEMSGWLHKEVKLRALHLEKHHVAALSIRASGGSLKLRSAADGTGPGFDVVFAKEAPRVRLARVDQREGPPEPPFDVEEVDASKLLALHEKLAAAATELTRHRKGIVEATLDGELLRTHAKPALLVERLIATIAPIVQEIASHSQSPGELVLRRLLGDGRREEIFLSKEELKLKLEPLLEDNRALFDSLWLDGNGGEVAAPSVSTRPSPAPVRADSPKPPFTLTPAAPVQPSGPPAALPAVESTGGRPIRQTPVSPAVGTPEQKPVQRAGPLAPPVSELPRRDPPRYRPGTPTLGTPPQVTALHDAPTKPTPAGESAGAPPIRQRPGTPTLGSPPLMPALPAGPAAPPPASELPDGKAPRRQSGPIALVSSVQTAAPPADRAPTPSAVEPSRKEAIGKIEVTRTEKADPATRS